MKKYILTLLVLLTFSAVFAENKTPRRPAKQKFDWKKAEGEREKMREKFRSEHKKHIKIHLDFLCNILEDFHLNLFHLQTL